MDILTIIKIAGSGAIGRTCAHYLRKLSPTAWATVATNFQKALIAAQSADADACGQVIASLIEEIK